MRFKKILILICEKEYIYIYIYIYIYRERERERERERGREGGRQEDIFMSLRVFYFSFFSLLL